MPPKRRLSAQNPSRKHARLAMTGHPHTDVDLVYDGDDRISDLPDEILHMVLACVPDIRQVVRTAVLSSRWRYLWLEVPFLRLPSTSARIDAPAAYALALKRRFSDVRAPALQFLDLHLPCSTRKANRVTSDWVSVAASRSVHEVRFSGVGGLTKIPGSIYSCGSLVILELYACTFPAIPMGTGGFGSLRRLCIRESGITDSTLAVLLVKCPVLENLFVIDCSLLTELVVSTESLEALKEVTMNSCDRLVRAAITAPAIVLEGDLRWIASNSGTALQGASIEVRMKERFYSRQSWMELVNLVSQAEALSVNSWFFQYELVTNLDSGIFKNLKKFDCDVVWIEDDKLGAFASFLGECPLLEELYVNLRSGYKEHQLEEYVAKGLLRFSLFGYDVGEEFQQASLGPTDPFIGFNGFLEHLKIVTVKECVGTKNVLRLLEFLLGKAIVLEKLIVFNFLCFDEKPIRDRLSSFPKASSGAEIISK